MPYVDFLRPIPPISLFTLFGLFLGIGLASKIALIFPSGFWFMVLATSEGMRSLPADLLRAGRSVGMNRLQIFRPILAGFEQASAGDARIVLAQFGRSDGRRLPISARLRPFGRRW